MSVIKTYEERQEFKRLAATLFSPRTPIDTTELFSGRYRQIIKVDQTIAQPGAHAIIYGERGVGKTSLANIAPIAFHVDFKVPLSRIVAPRINCDGTDTYDSLWRKVFSVIYLNDPSTPLGFLQAPQNHSSPLLNSVNVPTFTPGHVQRVLQDLGRSCQLIVTFDEFDRLPSDEVPRLMADTIKSLSDNNVSTTIIVVGVGDSVSQLVRGHESVGRHLVEIPLPRMSREELEKIVQDRLPKLQLTIEDGALSFISSVCAGLPYFTHLLGQHAVIKALDDYTSNEIKRSHVDSAMKRAIEDSEREMKSAYYEATRSRHPKNRFAETLAACALTTHDDFGYFTAGTVREALSLIRGQASEIPTFLPHLERFCEPEKGAILQTAGQKHQV